MIFLMKMATDWQGIYNKRDWLSALGLPPNATEEDAEKAYKRKVREIHPDRHGGSDQSVRDFQEFQAAKDRVENPNYTIFPPPPRYSQNQEQRHYRRAQNVTPEDVNTSKVIFDTHKDDYFDAKAMAGIGGLGGAYALGSGAMSFVDLYHGRRIGESVGNLAGIALGHMAASAYRKRTGEKMNARFGVENEYWDKFRWEYDPGVVQEKRDIALNRQFGHYGTGMAIGGFLGARLGEFADNKLGGKDEDAKSLARRRIKKSFEQNGYNVNDPKVQEMIESAVNSGYGSFRKHASALGKGTFALTGAIAAANAIGAAVDMVSLGSPSDALFRKFEKADLYVNATGAIMARGDTLRQIFNPVEFEKWMKHRSMVRKAKRSIAGGIGAMALGKATAIERSDAANIHARSALNSIGSALIGTQAIDTVFQVSNKDDDILRRKYFR